MDSGSDLFAHRIAGYRTVVDDHFDGHELDASTWLPYYLPHWAGRDSSRARYRLQAGLLELYISPDQRPWLPDVAGDLRVSSLQTGCRAGPIGSTIGQHRTDDRMRVVAAPTTAGHPHVRRDRTPGSLGARCRSDGRLVDDRVRGRAGTLRRDLHL